MPRDRRRGQWVGQFPGDAEATGEPLWWPGGVPMLQVSAERRQAAETPGATARTAQRRVPGQHAGAAGLAVPLQEERTGTFGTQLLLHHLRLEGHQETTIRFIGIILIDVPAPPPPVINIHTCEGTKAR